MSCGKAAISFNCHSIKPADRKQARMMDNEQTKHDKIRFTFRVVFNTLTEYRIYIKIQIIISLSHLLLRSATQHTSRHLTHVWEVKNKQKIPPLNSG